MVRDICNNINAVRPGIEVIQTEVEVEGIGRIDILAKEKKTRQHAIIEVKASQQNPNTQLLAYGVKYDNPILIAITKVPIPVERQLPGIEYIVYTAT